MKKFLTILMATILAVLCLTSVACKDDKKSSSTDFVGSWTLIQVTRDNVDVFDQVLSEGMTMVMNIKKDGNWNITVEYNGTSSEFTSGTYTVSSDVITLTAGGDTQTGTIKNSKLVVSGSEKDGTTTHTMSMTFTKQSSSTVEDSSSSSSSSSSEVATASDFVGTWNATQVIEDDVDVSDEFFTYVSVTLTINSDGTFSMAYNEKETSYSDATNGTYTVTDGTIYLTAEGETIPATINANGKLDLTQTDTDEGVTTTFTIIFTK